MAPTEFAPPAYPGNYVGLEWTEHTDVKHLAYGLRVNAELALLATKGLRTYEAETGTPPDDVYELVTSLVWGVAIGAYALARSLNALPEQQAPDPDDTGRPNVTLLRRRKEAE